MTEDVDQIELGRQAWQRLQEHQRTAWADWRAVGEALKIGKDAALKAANAKSPHGRTYVRIFGAWLREHGLDEIRSAHRYRLLMCIENIAAIEAWRAGLPERQRDRYNHPDSIWFAWRRDLHGEQPRAMTRPYRPPNQSGKCVSGRYHRALGFDQDVVRRVAVALREHWCNDVYKLARVVLEAAFPNEDALRALLPADPPAKPAAQQKLSPARPRSNSLHR